jgi:putative peptide zinc metalloprotease protein
LLPWLREDLELRESFATADGSPMWLIYDALQHRYIQIDHATFKILSRWRLHRTIEALASDAGQVVGVEVRDEEIDDLVEFLRTHHLLAAATPKDWQDLSGMAGRKGRLISVLAHNYLFFKVPLATPESFLRRTLPLVEPLFTRAAALVILLIGLAGLYLVTRQWDRFIDGALALTSLSGAALLGVSLFVVKIFHELGHAYAAVRFGCRVPSLGVAFIMMTPMLYTDVTDAWRLTSRRQRLAIDAAGVIVELALAALATAIWAFLPPGTARDAAFLLATTSWIMSVGINLNPLMRFDGYYILADLLRIENLQARSFELGVWRLREVLFDLGEPPPERLGPVMTRALVAYAWSVWIYRLVLFTGIALVVYHYFFKALGVALFLFEIAYFIGRPLADEVSVWWRLRGQIRRRRRPLLWAAGLAAMALVVLVPWSTTITAPAVIEARRLAHVHPPRAARIVSVAVEQGRSVTAGALLVQLEAPDIEHEKRLVAARLQRVRMRLARRVADDLDREESLVLEREQAALVVKLQGLVREEAELAVRAPIAGRIVELNPELRVGRWLAIKEPIAVVASEGRSLRGYVSENGMARLKPGAIGRFVPDDPEAASASVVLREVATASAPTIEIPDLAGQFGGPIATQPDSRQRPVPVTAQFSITMEVPGDRWTSARTMRGVVHLKGEPESLAAGLWRQILKVLVRESGA